MTCAKKHVCCYIVHKGKTYVGTNKVNKPQKTCPRGPNEGYKKCTTICDQPGHAEEMALKAAEGVDLTGAVAYLSGIGYYCKSCQEKLFNAGIESLRLM